MAGEGVSAARQKGTLAESAVARWLVRLGYAVERRALHGNADRGDIIGVPNWTIEIKNVRTPYYQAWLREAEAERKNAGTEYTVVLHKPHGVSVDHPEEWVAVMSAGQWAAITKALRW